MTTPTNIPPGTKLCHPDFHEQWDKHTQEHGCVGLTGKQFNLLWDSKDEPTGIIINDDYRMAFAVWRNMTIVLVSDPRHSTLAQHM